MLKWIKKLLGIQQNKEKKGCCSIKIVPVEEESYLESSDKKK